MTGPPRDPRVARGAVLVPVVIAMLSMIGPFSIDTPFPAFPELGEQLDAGSGQLQLLVTSYLFSFGLMSVLHGPISDAVGRRPVMLAGCAVYALASLGAALSTSLWVLLAFRCVQGLSAGAATIISRTLVRDLYDGAEAHRLMSTVMVIFGLAPAVAPVIGGLLLQVGPWPLVFVFQAGLGALLIVLVLLVLPETLPPERRVPLSVAEVLRGLGEVLRTREFHVLGWALALFFGGYFVYIGGAALVVVDLLGLGELDFWKLFVPMIGGMMLGSWGSGRLAGRVEESRLVTSGMLFASGAAVLGVLLAAGAGPVLPWAVTAPALIGVGVGVANPVLQIRLLDLFPHRRGAVASAATFVTLVFNAVTAATITPYAAASLTGVALAAAVMVLAGTALWLLHVLRPGRPAATPTG